MRSGKRIGGFQSYIQYPKSSTSNRGATHSVFRHKKRKMSCDTCDYGGATIRCRHHPLLHGTVKEFYHAMLTGDTWGDIVYELEMAMRELMTPEEVAKKEAENKKKSEEALVKYHIHKKTLINVDAKTGQLKKRLPYPCKWANHPAENGYPAGCAAQHKGCCEYLHPGEEGYEDAKNGRKPSAGSPLRNVTYLSCRPQTPMPSTPTRDAW